MASSEGPVPDGQTYVEHPPIPALAGVASSVWIQRVAANAEPYTQRNIATGGVELICAIGAVPRVIGPLTLPLVEVLEPGTTVVGMRFHPGAAAAALGLPASELVDLALGADDVWDDFSVATGELVHEMASPEAALVAFQRQVVERISEPPDPVVAEAVRGLRWGGDDVGAVASSLYISERQLWRRCLAAVGVAPKALHRMLRFQRFVALTQHAVAQGQVAKEEGLARVAADVGYADQAHLSRECARLTGMSPAAFLAGAQEVCACGHDHSASFSPLLDSRSPKLPAASRT